MLKTVWSFIWILCTNLTCITTYIIICKPRASLCPFIAKYCLLVDELSRRRFPRSKIFLHFFFLTQGLSIYSGFINWWPIIVYIHVLCYVVDICLRERQVIVRPLFSSPFRVFGFCFVLNSNNKSSNSQTN